MFLKGQFTGVQKADNGFAIRIRNVNGLIDNHLLDVDADGRPKVTVVLGGPPEPRIEVPPEEIQVGDQIEVSGRPVTSITLVVPEKRRTELAAKYGK